MSSSRITMTGLFWGEAAEGGGGSGSHAPPTVDSPISLWKPVSWSRMATQTPVDGCEGATLAAGALMFWGEPSAAAPIQSMRAASAALTELIEFVYEP